MPVRMFTFVEMYRRSLVTAAHLLDKGAAFAAHRNVAESEMLEWRLIEDMNPLSFQLMVVVNFAGRWPARALGIELPAEIDSATDVAGFQAAIAGARAFLDRITPDQFEGRDDTPLTFKIQEGMEPTMAASRWLEGFATTNLTFHLSMAYGILRAHGVPLGKVDLFAGGL